LPVLDYGQQAVAALYQSQSITCRVKPMDFFVWQERSRERSREFAGQRRAPA
jgi:hypothetical protein